MDNVAVKSLISKLLYGEVITRRHLEKLGRYNSFHITKLLELPAKDLALKLQDDFSRKPITHFKAI